MVLGGRDPRIRLRNSPALHRGRPPAGRIYPKIQTDDERKLQALLRIVWGDLLQFSFGLCGETWLRSGCVGRPGFVRVCADGLTLTTRPLALVAEWF